MISVEAQIINLFQQDMVQEKIAASLKIERHRISRTINNFKET
jgi:DNA-binding transcriptional regulator LsrR (DeoR family)